MAKQRSFLENIGRFISSADRVEREQAFSKKRQRAIDRKAAEDLRATRLTNQRKTQEIQKANLDRQLSALDTQISVNKNLIKSINVTIGKINETAEPNTQELAQALVARNNATRDMITAQFQKVNLQVPQALPQIELTAKINQAVDGVTTQQLQKDAISSEQISVARVLTDLATDPDLKLKQFFRKAGPQAEADFLNSIFKQFDTLTGGKGAVPKAAVAVKRSLFSPIKGEEKVTIGTKQAKEEPEPQPQPTPLTPEQAQRVLQFRQANPNRPETDNAILEALNKSRTEQVPK